MNINSYFSTLVLFTDHYALSVIHSYPNFTGVTPIGYTFTARSILERLLRSHWHTSCQELSNAELHYGGVQKLADGLHKQQAVVEYHIFVCALRLEYALA